MNRPDPADADLRAAFAQRIDAVPEPSAAMFSRTLDGIDAASTPARVKRWASAAQWWEALAAPARFALALAIVMLTGTITFGTLKVTRERANPARNDGSSIVTIDRRPMHEPHIASAGTMQLTVHDVPGTLRRIAAIADRERGTVLARSGGTRRTTITLRIPANRLDASMQVIATFGDVKARAVRSVDLGPALTDLDRRLTEARAAHADRASPRVLATLRDEQRQFTERLAKATLAVTLDAAGPGRIALASSRHIAREPSHITRRPTSTSLARGSSFAPSDSLTARRRARLIAARSSRLAAARSFRHGAAT